MDPRFRGDDESPAQSNRLLAILAWGHLYYPLLIVYLNYLINNVQG